MRIVLDDSDLKQNGPLPDFRLYTVGLNDFKISEEYVRQADEIIYRSSSGGFERLLKDRNGVDYGSRGVAFYGSEPAVPEKPKLNSRYDLLKRGD